MSIICAAVVEKKMESSDTNPKKNDEDEIAICSDSLTTINQISFIKDKKNPKIFRINGSYIGLVGYSATAIIFEHVLNKKSRAELDSLICLDNEVEIHGTLNRLHPILKKEYFIKTEDKDYDYPTELSQLQGLIINQNGVFRFDETRGVTKHKFFAVGSGNELALGAMYALYNSSGEHSARDIVEMGVKAASEFNINCGLPLDTYVIKKY